MEEQKEFKKRLLQALACNTNEPRLDETTIQYLQRKGQRRSEVARHGIARWKAKVTVETKKERRRREQEIAKWKKSPTCPSLMEMLVLTKCQMRGVIV